MKVYCLSLILQYIQIRHAEMKLNGGVIIIGDHCGADTDKQEALVTITFGVVAGEVVVLADTFQANGGEIVDEPLRQFQGRGEQRYNFCIVQGPERYASTCCPVFKQNDSCLGNVSIGCVAKV